MSLFGGNKKEQHPEQEPEQQSVQEPVQQSVQSPGQEPVPQDPVQEPEKSPETQAAEAPPASRPAQPAENGYWTRPDASQRPTTPSGYGQGYQQPYQPPQNYPPYPPGGYNGNYPNQPYRPVPYQYNPNSGWQQPPSRPPENYQWNFEDYDKAEGGKTKKKRSRGLVVFVASLICVLALGLTGVSAYGVYSYLNSGYPDPFEDGFGNFEGDEEFSREEAQLEIVSKPQISESLPVGGKMTVPQVAKAVAPSVVGVVQYQPDMYLEQTGSGSGIVMSADGYIITNAHVVAGGTAFKVILSDGTPQDADLVGEDTLTDLAVLKVSGVTDLIPAVFGDSTQIEVGEQVIAIGNPAGVELAGSVTMGVISGANREIPAAGNIPLIQTDAAINPGNSGGALVNEYGQVIGINSSKIVAAEFEGIGFAIPISEAKPIVDDIVNNGRVTGRVKLGIRAREIDEIDARQAGLQMGVRIESIDPDSDLMGKNIQRFDIITHIDGERVFTMYDLKKMLDAHKPGDRVTLTVFRQVSMTRSDNIEVTIVLMEDK